MRDFLRRIRLPLLFAALLLVTTTLMVVDRRTVSKGGSDHSWLSGVLIEIAAPIQKGIRLPVDFLGERDGITTFAAPVPLSAQNLSGHSTSPTTVDWDRDGDEGLICGYSAGTIGFIAHLDGGKCRESGHDDQQVDNQHEHGPPDAQAGKVVLPVHGQSLRSVSEPPALASWPWE